MADLLKKFQGEHVPMKDGEILHKTVVHGDQLTEERARNVQWTYKLGETDADRLEGLELTFSEFHLKMCMFEVNLICSCMNGKLQKILVHESTAYSYSVFRLNNVHVISDIIKNLPWYIKVPAF